MGSICIHMNGAQCAESYCDLWSTTEKKCIKAVIEERKAELLEIFVERSKKIDNKGFAELVGSTITRQLLH